MKPRGATLKISSIRLEPVGRLSLSSSSLRLFLPALKQAPPGRKLRQPPPSRLDPEGRNSGNPPPYNSSSLVRPRRLAACLRRQPGNLLQPGSALLADLGFKRQSVPSSCHVDQNGLHSRIWRTLRHLPTLSSAFSTLDRIHNLRPRIVCCAPKQLALPF
jgi:hypothetical protein